MTMVAVALDYLHAFCFYLLKIETNKKGDQDLIEKGFYDDTVFAVSLLLREEYV